VKVAKRAVGLVNSADDTLDMRVTITFVFMMCGDDVTVVETKQQKDDKRQKRRLEKKTK